MATFDGNYVKQVVDNGSDELDVFVSKLDDILGDDALGVKPPTDEQLAAFFFQKQVEYPPVPLVMPNGQTIVASPYIVALGMPEVVNGNEFVNRFNRFIEKNGGVA